MRLSSTELLATLVAFDSTSRHSNLALIEWVANYFSHLGVEPQLNYNADRTKANLFATIGPLQDGGICLHGHTDVVPVDGQHWQTDPFQLTERDGQLFGRGTCDMKAWIACSLAAAQDYCAGRLRTPIQIALSYDEEVGCLGAPHLIAMLGNGLPKPRVALVGEPSLMAPITAHKGLIALDTTITGRDAHASLLHLGVSALSAAAEMAAELAAIAEEWMNRPGPAGMLPSGPTVNVGQLHSGVARNIIAREARLSWELRFRATDDADQLLATALTRVQSRLRHVFGDRLSDLIVDTREVVRVPAFDAGSDGIAERLARGWGAQGEARGVPYGAEAGQYAAAGVATLICGPGSIEQAHQPNEYVAMSQLAVCDRFLARLGEWAREAQA
ncbi:MAG TPA: acetylornithine deacetylase [Polyangiaceae bacterium]|nr:acetylornithine deacetylase [Polyangiaceae bacterium]